MPARDAPLVTVLITFYNLGPLVAETLDNVLAQTYPAKEIIAVDDGSTDDTGERCRAFGDRITYVHQANAGSSAARNAGLRRARGSLIAHLDGDDLWEPQKLAVQVDAARRFPQAGLIVADGIEFSTEGTRADTLIGPSGAALVAAASELVSAESFHARMVVENFVATPSQVMVPAHVYREVGLWNPAYRVSPDVEMYLRISVRYPVVLLRDKLVRWRFSPGGVSGHSYYRGFNWVAERPAILRAHLAAVPPEQRPALRATLRRSLRNTARAAYHVAHKHGERRWATRYLVRMMRTGGNPHIVLPYLLGIWMPSGVAAAGAKFLRRGS